MKSYKKPQWVYVDKERGWINIHDTAFIDIEEGPFGDEYSFMISGSEEVYKSRIVSGSQPG